MDTSPFPPPSSARKRRFAERTIDLNSFFSREEDRPKKPRFLLMACAEEGKTFKTVSAVRLARAIEEAYGKLQAVVRQRNGTILFEARTDEQIVKIQNTKQIAGLQVVVTVHPTLNLSKGVVNHEDFATETEEDLLNFFKTHGVTEVYRIGRKEQGKVIPTSTLILTFDRPSLPERIVTAFYNLRVRQYVPNPLRCFKCQRFGHTQQRCMSVNAVCGKCGSSVHDQQPCDKPPHCVNCEGDHPANDNQCPTFLREREIQKIRVTEKVSFPEAKRRFQIRNPVDLSRSFSSAVKPKSPGVTASCQTHCTPAVVSHFSCQVSPVDFPEDSACIQGGKIIIPTKYKKPVQKLHQTSTTSTETSTEIDLKQTPPPRKNTSSKSRPPLSVSENHIGRSSSPYRSRSPVAKSRENPPTISSSSQDDSAVDEEPHESSSKTFQKVRKKKKQPKK